MYVCIACRCVHLVVYVHPLPEPPCAPPLPRYLQESSNGVSIGLDSSRCSLKVSGPPAAVEVCRKEVYAMLGAVFRGQFQAVSECPRGEGAP